MHGSDINALAQTTEELRGSSVSCQVDWLLMSACCQPSQTSVTIYCLMGTYTGDASHIPGDWGHAEKKSGIHTPKNQ